MSESRSYSQRDITLPVKQMVEFFVGHSDLWKADGIEHIAVHVGHV